ncbi:MAG: hypothetical protein MMC23_001802 [Stictis urceolatum]|nr:hypothetical protein [Stictis urceolata]
MAPAALIARTIIERINGLPLGPHLNDIPDCGPYPPPPILERAELPWGTIPEGCVTPGLFAIPDVVKKLEYDNVPVPPLLPGPSFGPLDHLPKKPFDRPQGAFGFWKNHGTVVLLALGGAALLILLFLVGVCIRHGKRSKFRFRQEGGIRIFKIPN